jgi:hypothetical protein
LPVFVSPALDLLFELNEIPPFYILNEDTFV